MRNWRDGFASVADHAVARGVVVLVEALPKAQSDVCNTVEEAVSIVREIASPGIRTMFDTHNAADETEPHAVVLDRNYDYVRHIHVNEMDGRYPGTSDYDFQAIFRVLRDRNYPGWVSLEVFDFKPDAVTIATNSLRYLERQIQSIGQVAEAR
jgi:sugar phosphate isomerase/epimerase